MHDSTCDIDMDRFAEMLGIKRGTAYKMKYKGDFPRHYKVGGVIRMRQSDIDEWLESKAVEVA